MIRNLSRNSTLTRNEIRAESFFLRMRGLIGRRFEGFDGMLFPKCSAIHTCFMSMKIDVLFLSEDWKVLKACPEIPCWKMCVSSKNAYAVLELPAGTIMQTGTVPGDHLAGE